MAAQSEEQNGALRDQSCSQCQRLKKQRKKTDSQPHSFAYHVDLSIFQKKKKEDKKSFLERKSKKKTTLLLLENIVSALRNTLGGSILVHLIGHQPRDQYLGHFDDFVGSRFKELIQNGDLYVDTYTRKWIDEDFILITVTKSDTVSTVNFNTKVNTDFDNTSPTLGNILTILKRQPSPKIIKPLFRNIGGDLQRLHECRSIQLKCYMPKDTQVKTDDESYIPQVVDFIWNDLKFNYNLTSMSKVEGGGSFFVGVEEKDVTETSYQCKEPCVHGFDLNHSDRDKFRQCFLQKFQESVTVLDLQDSFHDNVISLDLINLCFHDYNGACVLEIAVRYFDGIIFYDKEGPRAYKIEEDKIKRMNRREWLDRIKSNESSNDA